LAEAHQAKRCPYCDGPLHCGHYQRKPRGGPGDIPDEALVRFSFCCGNPQCRRRSIAPSVRFMGRRVYWYGIILVVVSLLQNTSAKRSMLQLQQFYDVDRKTILRWRQYFQEIFPSESLWQRLRGRLSVHVKNTNLPFDLLNHFILHFNDIQESLIRCLRFLAQGGLSP